MSLEIKSFIAKNGERFSPLYSSDDPWPLFYPTAFIVRSVRQSCPPSTQRVYLDAIKRLLEWAAKNEIDLEVHFQRHDFLHPHEIDSLARNINAARRRKQGDTISEGKGNTYVGYVAKYLNWLANEVITDPNRPEIQNLINTQHRWLIDKLTKDGSKSAKAQKLIEEHLSEQSRDQLQSAPAERTGTRPARQSLRPRPQRSGTSTCRGSWIWPLAAHRRIPCSRL